MGAPMLDSSPVPVAATVLEEPDIVRADGTVPGMRLLFRVPEEDVVSDLREASVVDGRK